MVEPGPDLWTQTDGSAGGRRVWSVSEITRQIKLSLQSKFSDVWVEGEVSGVSRIATGTVFFSLKDQNSVIKCVIFASLLRSVEFELKDGIKIVCFGYVNVYEKRGEYQLYVQRIEPKGLGSLQLALEQLKQKLEKEGLFAQARKRPMPYLPGRIGVVTSVTGAAVKDILNVLDRRFSDVEIIISPASVQGETAKDEIALAIENLNLFNQTLGAGRRIEVVIVGRGGGSIEDLWAFNEEIVARAIYHSKIPVISAVGHERDWTIADLVADLRAPTPSAAAELVMPRKDELRQSLDDSASGLSVALENIFRFAVNRFEAVRNKLSLLSPAFLLQQHKTRIDDLAERIGVGLEHFLEMRQAHFRRLAERLAGLSPLNILGRGYSITFKMPFKESVRSAAGLKKGDIISTILASGEILSEVTEVKRDGRS